MLFNIISEKGGISVVVPVVRVVSVNLPYTIN